MTHATTRVSSDMDEKRPENHQGIVSTRFNFNIPQEWPIAITVVKTTVYTKWEKSFPLTFCYICHDAIFRGKGLLLTWLYGAKIRFTSEKICINTRKRYLNNSYFCYKTVKNEKNVETCFIFNFIYFSIFFYPLNFFSLLSFSLLRCSLLRYSVW